MYWRKESDCKKILKYIFDLKNLRLFNIDEMREKYALTTKHSLIPFAHLRTFPNLSILIILKLATGSRCLAPIYNSDHKKLWKSVDKFPL